MVYWNGNQLTIILVTVLVLVAAIECFALYLGFDGVMLATVIGLFCTIGGAIAKTIYDEKKGG